MESLLFTVESFIFASAAFSVTVYFLSTVDYSAIRRYFSEDTYEEIPDINTFRPITKEESSESESEADFVMIHDD